jgi:hypothetical protein
MAAIDAYANFAYSKVFAVPVPPTSGLQLTLAGGTAARLPAVPFNAAVWSIVDYPDPTNAEIVRVTAIAGDLVTMVRAQEGTTARAIQIGDAFAATITKKTLDDLRDAQNLNAGTMPVGRLPPTVPLLTADNHWTGKQYLDGQPEIYTDPAATVGQKSFRQQPSGGYLNFESLNEVTGLPVAPTPLRLKWGGGVYVDELFINDRRAVDLETIYPIGSVYLNALNEANPATYFGFGTWVPFGPGRALVCYDITQAEFNAAEKTGGEKTHTNTIAEMPYHTHVQDSHVHTIYDPGHAHAVTDPGHVHTLPMADGSHNNGSNLLLHGLDITVAESLSKTTSSASTGVSVVAGATGISEYAATPTNQYAGGGLEHNNLQPFITCFMWKRTA